MNKMTKKILGNAPQLTLLGCITTSLLSKTGGRAASLSMQLGYLAAIGALVAIFLSAIVAQIKAKRFQPISFWTAIMASTILGKTLFICADCSLGVGYTVGTALLTAALVISLAVWPRRISLCVRRISGSKADLLAQGKTLSASELAS